jgi:hypothetical protein
MRFEKIDAMSVDDLKQFFTELTNVAPVSTGKKTFDPLSEKKQVGTAGFPFWNRKSAQAPQVKK